MALPRSRFRRRRAAVAFALVVLLVPELGLRLCGFGAREPFYRVRLDALGRTWGAANRAVGENWFRGAEWEPEIKHPRAERFPAEPIPRSPRPSDAVRIFVLGESSAYGTPWADDAAWPALLRGLLATSRGAPVEVYNVGVRASTLDIQPAIVRELRAYQPDLFVLYAGHNEYYGVREPTDLEDLRVFRLIAGLVVQSGDPARSPRIGLRAGALVLPGAPEHAEVEARAARDLTRLLDEAGPVPVLGVLPVANEADVAPVGSYVPPGAEEAGRRAAELVSMIEADPALAGDHSSELSALAATLPQHAGLAHALGLVALGAGDGAGARAHFADAIDLDTVPIRVRRPLRAALAGGIGLTALDQWAAYTTSAHYFTQATVSASASRARSITGLQAHAAELLAQMNPVSAAVARAGAIEHPRTALAAGLPVSLPREQLAAAWRAAIAADPGDGRLYAELAAVSDDERLAREAAADALFYGLEPIAGAALAARYGFPYDPASNTSR